MINAPQSNRSVRFPSCYKDALKTFQKDLDQAKELDAMPDGFDFGVAEKPESGASMKRAVNYSVNTKEKTVLVTDIVDDGFFSESYGSFQGVRAENYLLDLGRGTIVQLGETKFNP